MRIIGNAEKAREVQAVASGVLPSGQPVVVNANGTVSVAAGVAASVGSETNFESGQTSQMGAVYDVNANRVVIFYRDIGNSYYGTAVVGTVSGTSISFGSPVVFQSSNSQYSHPVYDVSAQKIVNYYSRDPDNYGMAIVGTVSGTSISFGTATVYSSSQVRTLGAAYASNASRSVVIFRDESAGSVGKAVSGGVSGTGISFGSSVETIYSGSTSGDGALVAGQSIEGNTRLLAFVSTSSDAHSVCLVASGTNVYALGSVVQFSSGKVNSMQGIYDDNANSFLIVYRDASNSSKGTARVVSVSGTTASYGATALFSTSTNVLNVGATYNSSNNNAIISYRSSSDSNKLYLIEGKISGTSIAFEAATSTSFKTNDNMFPVYNSSSNSTAVAFADVDNSNVGEAFVYGSSSTNLTAENYIGMSGGEIIQKGSAAYVGTPVVFESADTRFISSAFDTTNNKVVIAYRDQGNSEYSTAVVGTVSGNAISFGTPVVFSTEVLSYMQCSSMCFDPDTGKVVIAYRNEATSNHGTARVGTVSGTSISFGSAVVFEAAASNLMTTVYDTNSNKVVIAYKDDGNSEYGTAIVGTVSGTSISFGSPTVFNAGVVSGGTASGIASTFDSVNNKVILAYSDGSNSNQYTAIVGTVSGTSISFGTKVVIDTDTGTKIGKGITAAYNPVAQKVLITYVDTAGNLDTLSARVGTVSGTSISFGTEASTGTQYTAEYDSVYNPDSETIVIAYKDESNSSYGTLVSASISGTDVTFGTPTVYKSSRSDEPAIVYDSSNNKTVVSMQDAGSSSHGTSVVSSPDTVNIQRGQVADGGNAEINIKGAVAENQSGLTAGQSYYVQTDGTLSTTAGDPSVFAGTAVAATKLIVKG